MSLNWMLVPGQYSGHSQMLLLCAFSSSFQIIFVLLLNQIEIYSEEMLRLQLLDVLGTPLLLGSLTFLTLTPHFSPDILNIR